MDSPINYSVIREPIHLHTHGPRQNARGPFGDIDDEDPEGRPLKREQQISANSGSGACRSTVWTDRQKA